MLRSLASQEIAVISDGDPGPVEKVIAESISDLGNETSPYTA